MTRLSLEDSNLTGATPPALGTVTTLRNQEDLPDEQYEALSHALGMSVEDIRALGPSPDELPLARHLPAVRHCLTLLVDGDARRLPDDVRISNGRLC